MFVKICGITNEDDALLATAPPASYAFAVGPGSRSIARSPFDGDFRFSSPMTPTRPFAGRSDAAKSRVGGASSAVLRSRSRVCG